MKVTGPGSPGGGVPPEGPGAPDASKVGGPGKAKETTGAEEPEAAGRSFAETLAGRPPAEAAPVRATGVDPLTSDIAADLKAGKIDPKAALDRVVERVLDQQLGPNAPASLRDQLRDQLRDTISGDPFLQDRLRSIG